MLLFSEPGKSEMMVGLFAALFVGVAGFVMLIRWLLRGPTLPDPWSDEVAAELNSERTQPICHRCLEPHDDMVYFCPNCGAPVGTYTNWLPYPYLISIGDTLRIGTAGKFKRSPVVIGGFLFFGFVEFVIFAPQLVFLLPVYWFLFLRNLYRQSVPPVLPQRPAPASD